jgi:methyl-accepting chemotaxis protein
MPIKAQLVDSSILNAALDSVQTNIFIADRDFKLVYMNPLAEKTLKSIEMEILRVFGIRVDDFIGESIHKFHRDPDQVERILLNPSALPHEAFFDFGVVHLKTAINGVSGPEGDIIGYIVNWEDVSEKVVLNLEMANLIIELKNMENKE